MLVPAFSSIRLDEDGWPDPIKGNLRVYAVNAAGFLFIYFYLASGLADGNATCYTESTSDLRLDAKSPRSKWDTVEGD